MEDDKANNPVCCKLCDKMFSKKSYLQKHVSNIHKRKILESKFICSHCSKNFSNKANLVRHISKCAVKTQNQEQHLPRSIKCPMCDYEDSKLNLLQHYNEQHDIDTSIKQLQFENYLEFDIWKNKVEENDVSKYISFNSKKTSDKVIYYYRCHRSGFYKSAGKNVRKVKCLGSNKINGYCPSKIVATVMNESGKVTVDFLRSHVGHEMELERIPLSKSDRNAIAEKISQKVPFDELIKGIRDNVEENNLERIRLLTRKDLFNIEQLYNLKNESVRHGNDCASVEPWINETQENSCDSISNFYTEQEKAVLEIIYQPTTSDSSMEKCRATIREELLQILQSANNLEELQVIKKALASVPSTLAAMRATHHFPASSSGCSTNKRNIKPPRKFTSTKKKNAKTNNSRLKIPPVEEKQN